MYCVLFKFSCFVLYSSAECHVPRLPEIRWIFPIHGFAEISPPCECPPALFECRARQRIEERLEVLLTGSASSSSGPRRIIRCRAVTPEVVPDPNPEHADGVVVSESTYLRFAIYDYSHCPKLWVLDSLYCRSDNSRLAPTPLICPACFILA